jgi:hypothetical protein
MSAARYASVGLSSLLFMLRNVALGGNQWTVSRATGNGISAPVTTGSAGTITAYVIEAQQPALQTTPAPLFVTVDSWELYATTGTDLQIGDTVTSVADPTFRFQVLDITRQARYFIATLQVLQ